MGKRIQFALEEQRTYYSQKLLVIGVYNTQVLNNMTLSELENEYNYFYRNDPQVKRKGSASV